MARLSVNCMRIKVIQLHLGVSPVEHQTQWNGMYRDTHLLSTEYIRITMQL